MSWSKTIFAIIIATLLVVGCADCSDATHESVASLFDSPEVEGERYHKSFDILKREYMRLADKRKVAYAERDSTRRANLLFESDNACAEWQEKFETTDSLYHRAYDHFKTLGDSALRVFEQAVITPN